MVNSILDIGRVDAEVGCHPLRDVVYQRVAVRLRWKKRPEGLKSWVSYE